MRPRSWTVLLWALFVSTSAAAQPTGREPRHGTVLVAGPPGGEPPVLYVAARLPSLVDFNDLLEPRALLTPEARARVEVVPLGARSLVLVPVRDLGEGERLLLPVTGRTEAGEPLTLTLALVTRRDEVDMQARVSLPSGVVHPVAEDSEGEVATRPLASQEPGTRPRMGLVMPGDKRAFRYSGDIQARVDSVLRMERSLLVTVAIGSIRRTSRPWRLSRVRMVARCGATRADGQILAPVRITIAAPGQRWQRHAFSTLLPEGAGCLALTLEEDGPRTLHFEDVRLPP